MVALPVEETERDGHTRDIRSEEPRQQRKVNNDHFRLPRFQVRGRIQKDKFLLGIEKVDFS